MEACFPFCQSLLVRLPRKTARWRNAHHHPSLGPSSSCLARTTMARQWTLHLSQTMMMIPLTTTDNHHPSNPNFDSNAPATIKSISHWFGRLRKLQPQTTTQTTSTSTTTSVSKVRFFKQEKKGPTELGVLSDRKITTYTCVYAFTNHLKHLATAKRERLIAEF